MTIAMERSKMPRMMVVLLTAALLAACGGGGGPAGTPILNSGRVDNGGGLSPSGPSATDTVAVTYAVSGSAATADVRYTAADGSTLAVDRAAVPWSVTIEATPGAALSVTAVSNASLGALTATIRTAAGTLAETTSSTAFARVTASATCCTPP